jgi:hypothetical protein
MACACNSKKNGSPKVFTVTAADGLGARTYTSEIEAKAAAVRRKGSYTVK